MNKKLYVWLYAGSLIGGIVILVLSLLIDLGVEQTSFRDSPVVLALRVASRIIGLFLLFAWLVIHTIFYFLLLAKMWGAIQDGETEISVGKAIGFLFIPFFNIFWVFKIWGGFPSEYNAYAARNSLNVPELSSGIFIAVPIVLILTAFTIGFLVLPFVMIAAIMKVSDAVNALQNAPVSSNNSFYNPPPPSTLNLNG